MNNSNKNIDGHRTLDQFVDIIEQRGHEHLLQTVRGVGYRFSDK